MVSTKLSADDIITKIKTSRCHFDTNPTVLEELRYKRVPEAVLVAMSEAPFGAPVPPRVEVPEAQIIRKDVGPARSDSSAVADKAERAEPPRSPLPQTTGVSGLEQTVNVTSLSPLKDMHDKIERSGNKGKLRQIKILGYITEIRSPTSFEIEDYHVDSDENVVFEFENKDAGVHFSREDLRIGAEVEIYGLYNQATDELKAQKIKLDLAQFRKLKVTAVLDSLPEGLSHTSYGWRGTISADGRRIKVADSTEVLFKLSKSEKKTAKEQAKRNSDDFDEEDGAFQTLRTLADVGPGMVMTYEGVEQRDGTVLASRVEFMHNEMEKGEASIWKFCRVKEDPENFLSGKRPELRIAGNKYKILPSEEVQRYISKLGEHLIPFYQRALQEGDPNKIPFRFYVVVNKEPNATAYANGVVIVHTGLLDILENEAQLASVMSHEIAHAVQEHTWRQEKHHQKKRTALAIGALIASAYGYNVIGDALTLVGNAMVSGYARTVENQADRVGLGYMVAAGYDPMEAPRVWKLMAQKLGDQPTNYFYSNHDNHVTRRSFLMWAIRNNYPQLDYSNLVKNEVQFQKIAALAREAVTKKRTVKVTW
jgi:hypothetical protein